MGSHQAKNELEGQGYIGSIMSRPAVLLLVPSTFVLTFLLDNRHPLSEYFPVFLFISFICSAFIANESFFLCQPLQVLVLIFLFFFCLHFHFHVRLCFSFDRFCLKQYPTLYNCLYYHPFLVISLVILCILINWFFTYLSIDYYVLAIVVSIWPRPFKANTKTRKKIKAYFLTFLLERIESFLLPSSIKSLIC